MVVLRCSSRRWCDRCLALQWTASVACRWSFSRFWDDEVLPLICPTCQVAFGLTENANAGNHLATVHGVVFDVLGGEPRRPAPFGRAWVLQAVAQIVGFGLESLKMH